MKFTDEQIENQKEKLIALQYLVDSRTDVYVEAANNLERAQKEYDKQRAHLNFMKQNKETN